MAKEYKAMQVKHTKKGIQKLTKSLFLLQQNCVSVGIHKSDNRITSGERQSKEYRKLKAHLRKMEQGSGSNSSPASGSGLDKSETNNKPSTRKRSFNLATLAFYLEQPVSWIQSKTVRLFGHSEPVTIHAGARMSRPARTFIRIFKLPDVWDKIRRFVQEQIKILYTTTKLSRRSFWKDLGTMTKAEQQNIIQSSKTAMNSDLTTKIKGKNHPLFDTGGLLESIGYRVRKNPNAVSGISKNSFLMNLNEEMRKLR